jgi:hypothetical protein
MTFISSFITAVTVFAVSTFAAYEPDRILSLPGWNGNLPSNQYSGYLNVSTTHLHYYLVESENDPANDPTVFWFNGGKAFVALEFLVFIWLVNRSRMLIP